MERGQSDTIAHRSVAVQSSPLLVHVRGDICLALALWLRQRLVGRGLVGRTTHGSDGSEARVLRATGSWAEGSWAE